MSILTQKTISKKISIEGICVHTGLRAKLVILPAQPNTGILFKRVHLIKNNTIVPMYRTSIDCEPAGQFSGKLVVSMRPLNAKNTIRSIQISSRFPAVHGAPIHLGSPDEIGIKDIMKPEYGDPPRAISNDEIPVVNCARFPDTFTPPG